MKEGDKREMEALAEEIYAAMSEYFDPTTGEYISDYRGPLDEEVENGGIVSAVKQVEEKAASIRRLVGRNA